jgi:hypothetical protein
MVCCTLASLDTIAAPHGVHVIRHDLREQRGNRRRAEVRTKTDEDIAGARTGRDLLDLGMGDKPHFEETFQRYRAI